VLVGNRVVGSVTRYSKTWSSCAYDNVGNVYGLGDAVNKRDAVRAVAKFHDLFKG
jgi:hypothetical protein